MIYLILIILLAQVLLYAFFRKPKKSKPQERFEYLLILGCPTNNDGTLSRPQLKRIQAACAYYEKGYSDVIVISGGSVHNEFNEAEIMGTAFLKLHPNAKLHIETKARNTYQNFKYVKAQMGGEHILVVSGSSHLRRAYFMSKKFYKHACMGSGRTHDSWNLYLFEYFRMWNALYWEVRLAWEKRK